MDTGTAAAVVFDKREQSILTGVIVRLTSRLHGYTPPLLAIGLGMCFNYLSNVLFGPGFVGLFFVWLMIILIGAWCGYGPGLFTVFWVAVGVPFFFKPGFSLGQVNPWGIGTLAVVSLIVSRTAEARRNAELKLRALNVELDRRVKEKTAALRDSNQELVHKLAEVETLYAKLPVGLCFLDAELRCIRVNDQLANLNGVVAVEHVGKYLGDILPDALASAIEPLYRRVLDTGEGFANNEVRADYAEGGSKWWALSCSRVQTDEGHVLGLQVIVQNITERKLAEEALRRLNDELRQANSDLEQFAYSASHDLQEPLRMVSLYSQMLRKKFGGKLGADGDHYISNTIAGAKRMEQLIGDLLAYTQASGSDAQPRAFISAAECARRAVGDLSAVIAETGAEIEIGFLPHVRMHEVHLCQLFLNLIGNGIKYRSKEAPRISLRADEHGDEWVFAVSDNGIGIAAAYHQQIFGIFKRLHTAAEYSGTGIGLAICQRIVERNNGRIWVVSETGKGATFLFSLPVSIVAADRDHGSPSGVTER